MKILWIVCQDLSCYVFFYFVEHIFLSYSDFLELTFSVTFVASTALQLKFVFVTSFLLLGQLRDMPHSKKWLLNSLWNFEFYEHLLIKGQ